MRLVLTESVLASTCLVAFSVSAHVVRALTAKSSSQWSRAIGLWLLGLSAADLERSTEVEAEIVGLRCALHAALDDSRRADRASSKAFDKLSVLRRLVWRASAHRARLLVRLRDTCDVDDAGSPDAGTGRTQEEMEPAWLKEAAAEVLTPDRGDVRSTWAAAQPPAHVPPAQPYPAAPAPASLFFPHQSFAVAAPPTTSFGMEPQPAFSSAAAPAMHAHALQPHALQPHAQQLPLPPPQQPPPQPLQTVLHHVSPVMGPQITPPPSVWDAPRAMMGVPAQPSSHYASMNALLAALHGERVIAGARQRWFEEADDDDDDEDL
jgi:hypothetical protein